MTGRAGSWERSAKWLRRAFGEFLAVPIAVVVAFLLLAIGTYVVDASFWSANPRSPGQLRWLSDVFGDGAALSSLLSTIAASLITVTSITFSLLLVAVQQGASSLTSEVFEQFLRRRSNQFYFGFFAGLSVFALINLIVANQSHRPIFGALLAVLLTGVALCLIIVLIYTTIDQTRPDTIIAAIHGHVLDARGRQLPMLRATRRAAASRTPTAGRRITAECGGYVTAIDIGAIARAVARAEGRRDGLGGFDPRIEIELHAVVGSHAAFGDLLAEVRCGALPSAADAEALAEAVVAAIKLEAARDLERDPSFGIAQSAVIGWTSVSTARSNPHPGILVCHALRDILARWCEDGEPPADPASPIVYRDEAPDAVMSTLESLAVVASESMQHQTLAEIMRTIATLLPTLPPALADRAVDLVLRSLSALGEHVLTRELECALDTLARALATAGRDAASEAVTRATRALGQSLGVIGSRSTRAPGG